MPGISFEQRASSAEQHLQIGNAVSIMMGSRRYLDFRLAALAAWLIPAVKTHQIKIYFDEKGRPAAYVTWAFLDDDTQARWRSDPGMVLHASEWNEGLNLWIIDFAAPHGFSRAVMTHLRDSLFVEHQQISWLRRDEDGSILRAQVWRRRFR